jgi:ribosomal protein L7/L12
LTSWSFDLDSARRSSDDDAIASTTDRVSAIKALREQHWDLGLKAAADLVDAALDVRGE